MTIYEEKTDGAAATREEYLAWLGEEVAELGGAIDPGKVHVLATLLGPSEDFDGYTHKGKHSTLEMSRRDPSGCAARIAAPTPE